MGKVLVVMGRNYRTMAFISLPLEFEFVKGREMRNDDVKKSSSYLMLIN